MRARCTIAFLVLLACAVASHGAQPDARAGADETVIFVTRDLRGHLEPCDCKRGVLGGFPRRATVVATAKPDILLDAGDLVFQASPYDLLKLRFMLELEGRLGYAAVNVGRREAEFSKAAILRAAKESPVPLLSANLAGAGGKLVLPASVAVERSGTRFRIVGLVTPEASVGAGLRVLDPAKALRAALANRRGPRQEEYVILLAALNAKELHRVLRETAGVDLVLGGWVPRGSEKVERLGETPCFLVQGKGQYLGAVRLRESEGRLVPVGGERIVLGPEIASDVAIRARVASFKLSLKDLDLLGRAADHSPYVGSAACAACHGHVHATWKRSSHGRALSALTPAKGRFDPHCLRCHVTAPGEGGYVSEKETPELSGVGCESCHGPARAHVEAPLTSARPKTTGQASRGCMKCHESDHSRPFDEKERFAEIRHWRERRESER